MISGFGYYNKLSSINKVCEGVMRQEYGKENQFLFLLCLFYHFCFYFVVKLMTFSNIAEQHFVL